MSSSGSRPPFTPVQVQGVITATTANISWTVRVIAYTPENYTVTYNGLELQPEIRESALIVGDPTNILATDRMYFVLLEGLEEANTYNYTVNAINCNGTTSTDVMNFTTMPNSEITILYIIRLIGLSFCFPHFQGDSCVIKQAV